MSSSVSRRTLHVSETLVSWPTYQIIFMTWKDNFSKQASGYAQYRPHYPPVLFDFLNSLVTQKQLAWDCGTGNGQVAAQLASSFQHVVATDASQAQIAQADPVKNVEYRVATAENSGLPDHSVNLMTVAQAIHWFNFDGFYQEVKRVAAENAILAIWGYGLLRITPQLDAIIDRFYTDIVGQYWDQERRHLDNAYQTIPFPFEQLDIPDFNMMLTWNLSELIGYLNTWSSVQKYIVQNENNPVTQIIPDLTSHWGKPELSRPIRWDIFMKVAKL